MQQRVWIAMLVLMTGTAVAQVPLVGGDGASLKDIEGTATRVTVVLRDSGAKDVNLKILKLHANHVTVLTEGGQRRHYPFSTVQKIVVQGGVVSVAKYQPRTDLGLDAEEVEAVRRAVERAAEIFAGSNANQPLKMRAASVVIVGGEDDVAEKARVYLRGLVDSNDVPTALDASYAQYLAGEEVQAGIIFSGLESGSPTVRVRTAYLAGLIQDHSADSYLFRTLQDRAEAYSVPAAGALALLNERDVIPSLLRMLVGANEAKAEAALFGLVILGGDDVITQMKILANETKGLARLHVAEVLCRLGDPDGKKILREEMKLTKKREAALLLAPMGDMKAIEILRLYVHEKIEEDVEKPMLWRADSVAALLAGGDLAMVGKLVELSRAEFPSVQRRVYENIVGVGKRSLLSYVLPGVDKDALGVSMSACETVLALTDADFRQRFLLREMRAAVKPLRKAPAISLDSVTREGMGGAVEEVT